MMEVYSHSHFPPHLSVVHVGLYTSVENASLLRARIIKAAITQGAEGDHERDAVNFAFVDARLVSPIKLDFKLGHLKVLEIR
jgi:EKC/KEOPS complex subunit CGI121/TPRKB